VILDDGSLEGPSSPVAPIWIDGPDRMRNELKSFFPDARPTTTTGSNSPAEPLPVELMIHALKQLQPRDLQNVVLVSRYWFDCGVALLWERPKLDDSTSLRGMLTVINSHTQTTPYGEHVRRLNLMMLGHELSDQDLRDLKVCTKLERLTLIHCIRISDGILSELLGCTPRLLTLDLSGTPLTSDADLQVVAATSPELMGLNISNCTKVTDGGVVAIAMNCTFMQRIKLMGLDNITDTSLNAIALNCSQLVEIDLAKCSSISDIGVRKAWPHLKTLRELNLAYCIGLTDAAHPTQSASGSPPPVPLVAVTLEPLLLKHSQEHLRVLDLSGCVQLTDNAISAIIGHAGRISSLTLAKCTQLTDSAVYSICNLRRHLKSIHLGHVHQ